MSESELLPCPFCGASMNDERWSLTKAIRSVANRGFRHPTNDCLLAGYGWGYTHAARWNRREPDARGEADSLTLSKPKAGKK